jgi:hypothetical protein
LFLFSQISEVGVGSEHPKVDLASISGSQEGTFDWWQFLGKVFKIFLK